MTKKTLTVGELVSTIMGDGHPGFLKHALQSLVESKMAVEFERLIGAGLHERSEECGRAPKAA